MDTKLKAFFKGKRILVTGGTGSIGAVIVREVLRYSPKIVRVLSRDAGKQSALEDVSTSKKVRYILGDIRDQDRVLMACEDIDIIFHAAAFKFVPQGEYNPFEVIQTNVIGTQNLIQATLRTPSVTHFVMISTDKAVEPVNTMGASKLLAERLVSAAHFIKGKKRKVFTTVRFGNVLGSRGSVLPLFREQLRSGALTLTHPDMRRFFMTIPEAANLVFTAAEGAHGGEIFVLKMPAVAIKDLATVFGKMETGHAIPLKFGGIRAGEKIHEALLSSAEARSSLETKRHFIIIPQVSPSGFAREFSYPGARPLSSVAYDTRHAPLLSEDGIRTLIKRALAT